MLKKKDFDIGSFWVRKINGAYPFYLVVIKRRPLDVEFVGFLFDGSDHTGRYFFNWTELLAEDKLEKWEKLS
jgi:hypothetical protein